MTDNQSESSTVQILSLTWNMGNGQASTQAVDDFAKNMNGQNPALISISTQEEMAYEKNKKLHEQLLKKLNDDIDIVNNKTLAPSPLQVKYTLAVQEYHTTTAGMNNFGTMVKIIRTPAKMADNQVGLFVLVRENYTFEATSKITYETEKPGNKSIISISGELKKVSADSASPGIQVVLSGAHLDSNKDKKRRGHFQRFTDHSNGNQSNTLTAEALEAEACTYKALAGDLNGRRFLYKDGTVRTGANQSALSLGGFDYQTDPKITDGNNKEYSATYGHEESDKNTPDPRAENRPHVSKGGFLDKNLESTGLTTEDSAYGFEVDGSLIKKNTKGTKTLYDGSDHFPVIRCTNITIPTPEDKYKIVAKYISSHLIDFSEDIQALSKSLESNENLNTLDTLDTLAGGLQFYDSKLSSLAFLKAYTGLITGRITGQEPNLTHFTQKLEEKKSNLERLQQVHVDLKTHLTGPAQNSNTKPAEFVEIFNNIKKINELRNVMHDILGDDPKEKGNLSEVEQITFQRLAENLLNLQDEKFCLEGMGENFSPKRQVQLDNAIREMNNFLHKHPLVKPLQEFSAALKNEIGLLKPPQPLATQASSVVVLSTRLTEMLAAKVTAKEISPKDLPNNLPDRDLKITPVFVSASATTPHGQLQTQPVSPVVDAPQGGARKPGGP